MVFELHFRSFNGSEKNVYLLMSCRYSTWEPEEHILDQRLVQAYEEK